MARAPRAVPSPTPMKYVLICIGAGCVMLVTFLVTPLPAVFTTAVRSATIEDRNGAILAVSKATEGQPDPSESAIPQGVVDALIATEDRTFFRNPGLSLSGLARAFIRDVRAMRIKEGGSTITQQLVRLRLSPKRRGIFYKTYEALLALKIGLRWEKERVLREFLSTTYFGQHAYGIETASITYFNKSLDRLSLSESSLLVGLINAPSALNPFRNPQGAIRRRNLVLRALRETGKITNGEYSDAVEEEVRFDHGRIMRRAEHFVTYVRQRKPEELGTLSTVRTTLDLALQTEVEKIVTYQLEKLQEKNVSSAAVIVLDATNGDILAMLGSHDFYDDEHDGQVNLALAERQPGSALKPFTYALALRQGMTPATTIADTETQFMTQEGNPYIPRNYDYEHHGLVRLRDGLANSYNIVAVKILERIGVPSLLSFLKTIGITTLRETPEHYGLALTLGGGEVTLLELTRAYAMLARGGMTLTERLLLSDPVTTGHAALTPEIAWLITDILSDQDARLAEFGSSGPLSFPFPVAAKTGTTRNSRDNWTVGYTPTRVVGVWVGNADNSPMKGTSGVTGAGPIFHDVMIEAMKYQETPSFPRPRNITDERICKLSGKLPTPLCPETISEYFIRGTEPREKDDMFQMIPIDTRTQLLATETCDQAHVTLKPVVVFPRELKSWARVNGWAVPPDSYSPLCVAPSVAEHRPAEIRITSPGLRTSILLDPLIPNDQERVILEAIAPETIEEGDWYIDDQKIATARQPTFRASWIPTTGNHTIRFQAEKGSDTVHIEVLDDRE